MGHYIFFQPLSHTSDLVTRPYDNIWWESTGDEWIHLAKDSNAESVPCHDGIMFIMTPWFMKKMAFRERQC